MQLGNDIVDRALSQDHHPRFAQRILSPHEYQDYQANTERDGYDLIWHYWSAKEAAYKAYSQASTTLFSPSQWEVDLKAQLIRFETHLWPIRWTEDGDCLLAEVSIAEHKDTDWTKVHHVCSLFWKEPTPEEQSMEARRLACELAAELWGGVSTDYQVVKQGKIPKLQNQKGQNFGVLSLSHHGRWVAASLAKV